MTKRGLDEENMPKDPFELFRQWWDDAQAKSQMLEPTGMVLSTVDPDGRPSSRVVLLKHWDSRGFVFYSNYGSRKGRALDTHPSACLLFWWDKLRRQVRVEGRAERLAARESDAYFNSRPRGSQLGAWASMQSQPLDSRETLSRRIEELNAEFGDGPIPRPPHWGGYRLDPEYFEFWDDGEYRLHDRLTFQRSGSRWKQERLYP